MKYTCTYSFKSPFSIAEVHARLRDLGPWRWADAGRQRVAASLPPPDRGTVTISLQPDANTVELALDAVPENFQAVYDTVFAHILPAISATDIKQRKIESTQPSERTATRIFAYTFDSPLGLKQMLAKLNEAGPWTWYERDSDQLGEYISGAALRSPHRGIAKIYVENGEWTVSVLLQSAEPDARSAIENAERELFDRVLPSIGAHNLAETEPLD